MIVVAAIEELVEYERLGTRENVDFVLVQALDEYGRMAEDLEALVRCLATSHFNFDFNQKSKSLFVK